MEFMAALRDGSLDEQKPSLFELLSEQQLNSLLPPTLRYLLSVATQRYPRYLLRVVNSFDELYALAMLLVERHYLRTRGGSFTEHFYGLKRERALAFPLPRASHSAAAGLVGDSLKLSDGAVWANLAVLVGIPYLRRKLDEAHDVDAPRALLGSAYNRLPARPTIRQRLVHYARWFLRNVYPSLTAAYGFAVLVFNVAYMFDSTRFHHPLLWLVGTRVRRMTRADYQAIEDLGKAAAPGAAPGPRSLFSPREFGSRVLGSLSVLLPASIFALKFLEWWHASDFAKQLSRRAAEGLELPPPVVSGLPDGSVKGILKKAGGGGGASSPTKASTSSSPPESEKKVDFVVDDSTTPIALPSLLPVFTVPAPADSELCPICEDEITTATACQTGVVYCYTCIHKWVAGQHGKQEHFMADKMGKWESGIGRCAVTGRRVLGGTEGLRRIMI